MKTNPMFLLAGVISLTLTHIESLAQNQLPPPLAKVLHAAGNQYWIGRAATTPQPPLNARLYQWAIVTPLNQDYLANWPALFANSWAWYSTGESWRLRKSGAFAYTLRPCRVWAGNTFVRPGQKPPLASFVKYPGLPVFPVPTIGAVRIIGPPGTPRVGQPRPPGMGLDPVGPPLPIGPPPNPGSGSSDHHGSYSGSSASMVIVHDATWNSANAFITIDVMRDNLRPVSGAPPPPLPPTPLTPTLMPESGTSR